MGRGFLPREHYAEDFWMQTLLYLWGTPGADAGRDWIKPTPAELQLGKRGRRAVMRLLFDVARKGRGRPLHETAAYAADINGLRPAVLREAQHVLRNYRPQKDDLSSEAAGEYRAPPARVSNRPRFPEAPGQTASLKGKALWRSWRLTEFLSSLFFQPGRVGVDGYGSGGSVSFSSS